MGHSLAIIGVVALCTVLTRALPFWILGGRKEVPATVQYLGKVLPPAIMAILVVYCLKDINLLEGSRGLPEFLAVALVAVLHLWKKSTLLSIGAGTVFYMILVQAVF
ncbi:MAG TPA: branched-chain amino acid transporter permease [Candidatus Acetatifactor stercoripullorum]|uniref:Branched-chain amino acid transporter permease n=1 Tax=Candidatus Acetatifactor stercoripullorum TaxID=2838414 RepID=A0A9D1R5J1_9FIRM|nr:branched-chain amino acid transporter permease [Candidatus Acetatifactor stercoripullorum]HIW80903.1 branched-chain amino acid transporter permease [Candidatus Acetatifactor stercoripullorum]